MTDRTFNVLDLFAGAGGFGLGFTSAGCGYNLVCSLEVDKWAVETLEANNKTNHLIIQSDIRQFDTTEKIKHACPAAPDVIIGGPPCQGFSLAGPPKDPNDPRNSLFRNFVQWVDALKPKIFVMENVRGLLTRENEQGERVIGIITRAFQDLGYAVSIWELNAAHFGVAQSRERIFIVGHSGGVLIPPPNRTHFLPEEKQRLNGSTKMLKQAIPVIDAIGDLPELKAGEGSEVATYSGQTFNSYQHELRGGQNLVYNHVTMSHTKRIVKRYQEILNGVKIGDLKDDLKVRKRNGNGALSETEYSSNYRHLKPDMISFTIPASFYSNFIHPTQARNITSREAAR